MIIELPIIKHVGDQTTTEHVKASVITNFSAFLKWEENFQESLGYDLEGAFTKFSDDKQPGKTLLLIRVLYCLLAIDNINDFKSFTELFDFKNIDEIIKVVAPVFENFSSSSIKKN
jgi:hypothetical protein